MRNLIVRRNADELISIKHSYLDIYSYALAFDGPTSGIGLFNPYLWDIIKSYDHIMIELADDFKYIQDYSRLLVEAKYNNIIISMVPELTTAYYMGGSIEQTYALVNHFKSLHTDIIIINPCIATHINKWIEQTYQIPVAGILQPFELSDIKIELKEAIKQIPTYDLSGTWYCGTMSDQGGYARQYSLPFCQALDLKPSATILTETLKRCKLFPEVMSQITQVPNMHHIPWLAMLNTCEGLIHFTRVPTVVRMAVWAAAMGKIVIGSPGGFIDLLYPDTTCHLNDIEKVKSIVYNKEAYVTKASALLNSITLDLFKMPFQTALEKL